MQPRRAWPGMQAANRRSKQTDRPGGFYGVCRAAAVSAESAAATVTRRCAPRPPWRTPSPEGWPSRLYFFRDSDDFHRNGTAFRSEPRHGSECRLRRLHTLQRFEIFFNARVHTDHTASGSRAKDKRGNTLHRLHTGLLHTWEAQECDMAQKLCRVSNRERLGDMSSKLHSLQSLVTAGGALCRGGGSRQ
mgnify:CR=1 FL=1